MIRARRWKGTVMIAACLILLGGLVLPEVSEAKTAQQINADANAAVARFDQQLKGGAKFLATSKGVLVLPDVIKAAFVYGAQYGEGVLRVQNRNIAYYSIAGGSFGLSFGAQSKDVIICFRDAAALKSFEQSSGWQVGVSGAITMVNVGVGSDLSTMQINQPIVAFVVGPEGPDGRRVAAGGEDLEDHAVDNAGSAPRRPRSDRAAADR